MRRIEIDGAVHALVTGTPADLELLERQLAAQKGRVYAMPGWLHGDSAGNEAYIGARLTWLRSEMAKAHESLEALSARYDLYTALGDANRLQWVIQNVHALESSELFCWITGWTSDLQGHRLASALDRAHVRAIVHYAPPPPGSKAPLLLTNPWWARPFEVFSRAVGMPVAQRGRSERVARVRRAADVRLHVRRRRPGPRARRARVSGCASAGRWRGCLVAGGLAAAAVRRAVRQRVQPAWVDHPLWIEPLDDPLTVLLVPLVRRRGACSRSGCC